MEVTDRARPRRLPSLGAGGSAEPGPALSGHRDGRVQYPRDDGASGSSPCTRPRWRFTTSRFTTTTSVVGTNGRSIWILDDLTPVRAMNQEIRDSAAHLFAPSATIRWRYASARPVPAPGAGTNRPEGALLTYFLAKDSEDEITIQIVDSADQVIRTLSSKAKPRPIDETHPDVREGSKNEPDLTAKAGLNRAAWDLRHDGAEEIAAAVIDIGSPRDGPMALPGDYTVRLKVGEGSYTQPLQVTADPRVDLDLADLKQHLEFQIRIHEQMSEIADMVETIRAVRDQIAAREKLLRDDPDALDLLEMGHDLVARLDEIEEERHNPNAEVSYDILAGRHGGAQLYSRLSWLFEGAREHESAPTQGMRRSRRRDGRRSGRAT